MSVGGLLYEWSELFNHNESLNRRAAYIGLGISYACVMSHKRSFTSELTLSSTVSY